MSMIQHTPGPWEVQQYRTHIGFSIWAKDRGCITERWYAAEQDSPYGDEIVANARLIAAAPDLLEAALKILSNWTDPENQRCPIGTHELRMAVASAMGADPEKIRTMI